ncbi:uncharacterized protein LOC130987984 [Salvia miltiorrhiza]|uniref:uncharacterized protein LOC130987984 n=1 Tax=Salvia miltiorrhiza TaxID=226208 RepID=UPI0025AB6CDE|nr:uncharacterized protein LOC130987984 [Salvia miltiorrhiza]
MPMNRRSSASSTAAPPPSLKSVQSKLMRIVCRHERLKISFDELRSQVGAGLLEVEDVFVSLAVQLMKLVGLKTAEMAEESRFSTIVTSFDHSEPEDYMKKAMEAGNELMERQRLQLTQLIGLLQNIEAQVNSSQESIFQELANHQASIKRLFQQASSFVSSAHQSGRSNDVMQRVLKLLFAQVGAALGSVETGVEDMVSGLADKMCSPMVQYVHGLKVEMKTGTCSSLLDVVKEMSEAMHVRRLELEEARHQTKAAEASKIEAFSKLTQSQETSKKLMMSLALLQEEECAKGMREDEGKDESLLWELLRQKKQSLSDSPLGPNELLGIGRSNKRLPSKRVIPLLAQRPPKRPHRDSQSSSINAKMLLGSSPSTTTTARRVTRASLKAQQANG